MAKKGATSTAVAVVDEKSTAIAVPDYLKDYGGPLGTENIGAEDVTIPRIKIGQSMSPEVKNGSLAEGDFYLNVTGEVLAKNGEQLTFTPIAYAKEYILWRPREDNGGGILARAKPVYDAQQQRFRYKWDKPNESFDVKVGGKIKVTWKTGTYVGEDDTLDEWGSEIPGNQDSGVAATAHFNYVVALPQHGNVIAALSLSRSSQKKGKELNAMMKMGTAPMFARVFNAVTVDDHKDDVTYKNYKFRPAGFVQDEGDFLFYRDIAESFKTKGFTVDQSDGGDAEPVQGNKPL